MLSFKLENLKIDIIYINTITWFSAFLMSPLSYFLAPQNNSRFSTFMSFKACLFTVFENYYLF